MGKTSLITQLAKIRNIDEKKVKVKRVNNNQSTTIQDYIGSYIPQGNEFVFKKGALYSAMECGDWFLADEFNLAEPAVLNLLFPLLEGRKSIEFTANEELNTDANFRFFATQNNATYANRHKLPLALRNRFIEVQVKEFDLNEILQILKNRPESVELSQYREDKSLQHSLKNISNVYLKLREQNYNITLRELIKWLRRGKELKGSPSALDCRLGYQLISSRYLAKERLEALRNILAGVWSLSSQSLADEDFEVIQNGSNVTFRESDINLTLAHLNLENSILFRNRRRPPKCFIKSLVRLAFAAHNKEPILLVGPSSYKSLLVKTWTQICSQDSKLVTVYLTSGSETSELIGQIQPYNTNEAIVYLVGIMKKLTQRIDLLISENKSINQIYNPSRISVAIESLNKLIDLNENESLMGLLESLKNMEEQAETESKIDTQVFDRKEHFSMETDENHEDATVVEDDLDYFHSDNESIEVIEEEDPFEVVSFESSGENLEKSKNELKKYDDECTDLNDESNASLNEEAELKAETEDDGFNDLLDSVDLFVNEKKNEPLLSVEELKFYDKLKRLSSQIKSKLEDLREFGNEDEAALDYINKSIELIDKLQDVKSKDKTIFLFKEGPALEAVKLGKIILLEDFDLPSQAVTERLNSLLELDRSFNAVEDITSDNPEINISLKFQLFANVHQDKESSPLNLSPAIRSRFTEIRVERYSNKDLDELIADEIRINFTGDKGDSITSKMKKMRKIVTQRPDWSCNNEIFLIFKWLDLVRNANYEADIDIRILLGARFSYFERFKVKDENRFKICVDEWWKDIYGESKQIPLPIKDLFRQPKFEDLIEIQTKNNQNTRFSPFTLIPEFDSVRLNYAGITLKQIKKFTSDAELHRSLFCTPTPTLVLQLARIFASIMSGNALLLEGPPGVGKTAVVEQVCRSLGVSCERINLSASTTFEHLFGSIIPQLINGKRLFKWRDGKLVKAIKEKKWILLDEINLASAEVLQSLTPLLFRDLSNFKVPNNEQIELDLSDIRIFATMNPTSIGGGRSKLPLSIENLFSIVKLDEFNNEELRLIAHDLFRNAIDKGYLSNDLFAKVLELHTEIQSMYSRREIGRHGGPYEFNLRELVKFKDVLINNADDQQFHFLLYNDANKTGQNENQIRIVKKFFELTYSSQFNDPEDRIAVKRLIEMKFKTNESQNKDLGIDETVPDCVRIGSVYFSKDIWTPSENAPRLVHTNTTIEQLELLAAACQSKRTVLLEGDTCSKKSALVYELARLSAHKLVVIALNHDTEASNLIGQWVPDKSNGTNNLINSKIMQIFDECLKSWFIYVYSQIYDEDIKNMAEVFKSLVKNKNELTKDGTSPVQSLEKFRDEFQMLLERFTHKLDKEAKNVLNIRLREIKDLLASLNRNPLASSNSLNFVFVESEFVSAIKNGYWVLLDNVSSAPQEVIERINSLLEEKPSLNIYEYHDGEELSSQNGKIHSKFRLFTTFNIRRESGNKLSSAFLNRVIKICLSPLDNQLSTGNLLSHEAFQIAETKLTQINKSEIAKPLLEFNSKFKALLIEKKLGTILFTFRSVLKAISFIAHSSNEINSFELLTNAIRQIYLASLPKDQRIEFYQVLLKIFQESFKKLNENSNKLKNSETKKEVEKDEFRKLEKTMTFLQENLSLALFNILPKLQIDLEKMRLIFSEFLTNIVSNLNPEFDPSNFMSKLDLGDFDQIKKFASTKELKGVKEKDLDLIKPELLDSLQNLMFSLIRLVKDATFSDFNKRKSYLKRVLNVLNTFCRVIGLLEDLNSLPVIAIAIFKKVREVLCLEEMLAWFEPFESELFKKFQTETTKTAELSGQRAVIWRSKKELNKRIFGNGRSFEVLINNFKSLNIDTSYAMSYYVVTQWLGLLWTFNHSVPKQIFLFPKTQFGISEHQIIELECLCLSNKISANFVQILIDCSTGMKWDFDSIERELDCLLKEKEEKIDLLQSLNLSKEISCSQDDMSSELKKELNHLEKEIESFNVERCKSESEYQDLMEKFQSKFIFLQSSSDYEYFEYLNERLHSVELNRLLTQFNEMNFPREAFDSFGSLKKSHRLRLLAGIRFDQTESNSRLLFLNIFIALYMAELNIKVNIDSRNLMIETVFMDLETPLDSSQAKSNELLILIYNKEYSSQPFSLASIKRTKNHVHINLYSNADQFDKLCPMLSKFVRDLWKNVEISETRIDVGTKTKNEAENIYRIGLIYRSLIYSDNMSKSSTIKFNLNESELKQFESNRNKILNEMREQTESEIWGSILRVNDLKRLVDSTEYLGDKSFRSFNDTKKRLNEKLFAVEVNHDKLKAAERLIIGKLSCDSIGYCSSAESALCRLRENAFFQAFVCIEKIQTKLDESSLKFGNKGALRFLSDFVSKTKTTIALLSYHVINNTQQNYETYFKVSYEFTQFINTFFAKVFSCFFFTDAGVNFVNYFSEVDFDWCESEFERLLHRIEISNELLSSIFQGSSFITETKRKINEIDQIGTDDSNSQSSYPRLTQNNDIKDNLSYLEEKMSIIKKTFMDLLDRGKELEPVPSELISKIIDAIISMQSLDPRKISQRTLERLSSLGRQLSIELDEYFKKISLEDEFEWVYGQGEVTIHQPKLFPVDFSHKEKINDDTHWYGELQRRIKSLENTDSTEAKAELLPKFEELKKLLKLNSKTNIWEEVLAELSNNNGEKFQSDQLMSKVLVISNEIYLKLKANPKISELVRQEFYEKYYNYRQEIFNEDNIQFLNNEAIIVNASRISKNMFGIENKDKEGRIFKLVDFLKVLIKQFALFRNTLFSYPLGTSLTIKPSYIDYISLVAPLWPHSWALTSYLYQRQHQMPSKITFEQIGSQLSISTEKYDGLLYSLFYINFESKEKRFFVEQKSAKEILALVLEICEQNFENVQYLNLSCQQRLIETPNYQFYLSIFGQCVSLIWLAYFFNEEYILKELQVILLIYIQ